MSVKLDNQDKKLLFLLDKNARTSYVTLAKEIKLNKDTVKYRINNYLKTKILEGFYPLIDSSKLGLYSFRTYFSLSKATIQEENKIIDYLKNQKNVFYLFSAEGYFDIGFGFFGKTITEFKNFMNELKQNYSYIKIKHEGIFLKLYHFDRNYLTNTKRLQQPKGILQEPQETKIDETDDKILKLLSENARKQIIEIGKELNLTAKAIIYRIRNLEKKQIILGYKPKINLEKLNYSMYKVDIELDDDSVKEKIKKFVFQLPNIIHAQEVFNGSDLEFDIECKNYEEYEEIINKVRKEHGRNILKIKHYRTTKIIKTKYY